MAASFIEEDFSVEEDSCTEMKGLTFGNRFPRRDSPVSGKMNNGTEILPGKSPRLLTHRHAICGMKGMFCGKSHSDGMEGLMRSQCGGVDDL